MFCSVYCIVYLRTFCSLSNIIVLFLKTWLLRCRRLEFCLERNFYFFINFLVRNATVCAKSKRCMGIKCTFSFPIIPFALLNLCCRSNVQMDKMVFSKAFIQVIFFWKTAGGQITFGTGCQQVAV